MHVRRPVQSDFLLCGRTTQWVLHATSFLGTCILYTKVSCREREKKALNYVPEVVAKIYLMFSELFTLYQ